MTRIAHWTLVGICLIVAGTGQAQPTPGPTMPSVPPELERKFKQADIAEKGGLNKIQATSAGFAVEGTFETIDTNQDRIITLFEIGGYLAEKTRVWTNADTDGDGVVSRSEADRSPSLAQVFVRADRDGDGIVRRQEHESFSQTSLYQNVDLPYVVPNIIDKKF